MHLPPDSKATPALPRAGPQTVEPAAPAGPWRLGPAARSGRQRICPARPQSAGPGLPPPPEPRVSGRRLPAAARPPDRWAARVPAARLAAALSALVLAAFMPGVPLAAAGDPAAGCEAALAAAASEHGVPAPILAAIARAESGRAAPGSPLRPWPWTLNIGGRGHWFATEAEARSALAAALAEGRQDIDVGCFQINLQWHGQGFPNPAVLFDPATGARAAARFLAALHAESGDWRVAAARYHSRRPDRGEAYARRLEAIHAAGAGGPSRPAAEGLTDGPSPPASPPASPAPDRPARFRSGPPGGGPLLDLGRRLRPLVGGGA